jgi:hypothetical protein
MVAVAFKLTRDTRKSAKSGVTPRLSALTQKIAARLDVLRDGVNLHGRLRSKALKTVRFPAVLRLASAQIPSHHSDQINGS